ncbi:hypothetical protein BZL30_2238 [Mycobacterium kansasii]|uniref:Uncharacterized protein n=2 Tax=Mycobacterium kansasii TaxID=1768 RepID=A0A1V3XHN4_MYCKA|nr:hypothetical protein BZL30_2238 [Mycobacterium kansasii]
MHPGIRMRALGGAQASGRAVAAHSAPWRHTRRPGRTLGALAAHSAPSPHTRRPGGTLGAVAA